jgi:DNA-binding NarL/FixJ family response regulator
MDGREAINLARLQHPDVVLMDVVLRGGTNGIEAARSIQRLVDTAIVYVTGHSNEALVSDAVRSGAFGYVLKPFQARQITSSITIALQRRSDVRALEERARLEQETPPANASAGGVSISHRNDQAMAAIQSLSVTPREREVIQGLVRHRRVARVADVLGISVHTARNHLKSVFRKLNLHSQDELLGYLLDEDESSHSA